MNLTVSPRETHQFLETQSNNSLTSDAANLNLKAFPESKIWPAILASVKRWWQSTHQGPKGSSSNAKIIGVSTRSKLQELWISRVPGNNRAVKPSEKTGSNAIANQKPLAGQSCETPLAMRNWPLVFHAKTPSTTLMLQVMHRNCWLTLVNSARSTCECH